MLWYKLRGCGRQGGCRPSEKERTCCLPERSLVAPPHRVRGCSPLVLSSPSLNGQMIAAGAAAPNELLLTDGSRG
jgi:hypothetical protein